MAESSPGSPRSVRTIGRDQPGLGAALRHAEACAALNRKLADLIPADARTELGVVRVEHDCLVIAAASGSRAAQARRLSGELIRAAGQLWPSPIRRSRIFVKPGLNLGAE